MRKPHIVKRFGRWIVIYPSKKNTYGRFTELEHFRKEQAYYWVRQQNHKEFYIGYFPKPPFNPSLSTLKEPS